MGVNTLGSDLVHVFHLVVPVINITFIKERRRWMTHQKVVRLLMRVEHALEGRTARIHSILQPIQICIALRLTPADWNDMRLQLSPIERANGPIEAAV